MGAVYKRATKKGTIRWLGRYRDKNRKEHSRSFDTRREASAWVALMENKGTAPEENGNSGDAPTVLSIWNTWTEREEISPGSRRVYLWTLKNLKPVEALPLEEVTKPVLDRLYNDLINGRLWISPEDHGVTVENARATLGRLKSAAVHYANTNEGTPVPEPLLSWRPPRNKAGDRKRVDPSSLPTIRELREVERVLREGGKRTRIAPGTRPSPELADALQIAAVTGLRIGELVGLDVNSVDETRGLLYVRHQLTMFSPTAPAPLKTPSSRRAVPVPVETMKILKRLKDEARTRTIPTGWDSQPLFLNERNNPWQPGSAIRVLRKAQHVVYTRGRAGARRYDSLQDVKTWGWHSIRHLYASTLLKEGRPITEVAAALGHASPTTTAEIYSHALTGYEDSVRAAASSMVLNHSEEEYRERYGD